MIQFKRVTISFHEKPVINDFDLTVSKGEKVVLWGDSGTGKTTLFRSLLGFVRPQSGEITFNETPVTERTSWDIRKNVAYVPQNTDIGEGTVLQLIRDFFAVRINEKRSPLEEEVQRLFDQFELPHDTPSKSFEALSGGEKQRVVLSIALLLRRDIFLLDEITSALNDRIKDKVIDFFLQHDDWTVIAVSHDAQRWRCGGTRLVKVE